MLRGVNLNRESWKIGWLTQSRSGRTVPIFTRALERVLIVGR